MGKNGKRSSLEGAVKLDLRFRNFIYNRSIGCR